LLVHDVAKIQTAANGQQSRVCLVVAADPKHIHPLLLLVLCSVYAQIVEHNGYILEKPDDVEHARKVLERWVLWALWSVGYEVLFFAALIRLCLAIMWAA
jgi:hypothetical protein